MSLWGRRPAGATDEECYLYKTEGLGAGANEGAHSTTAVVRIPHKLHRTWRNEVLDDPFCSSGFRRAGVGFD